VGVNPDLLVAVQVEVYLLEGQTLSLSK